MIPGKGLSVITGPECTACIKLKNILTKLDVEYTEVSIFELPSVARSGLPQIYLDGEIIFKGSMSTIMDVKKFLRSYEIKYKEE